MAMAPMNRRTLLKHAAAAPFFVRNLISAPPSGTLRLASFGGGGMAAVTLEGIARHPAVRLVSVAEVDATRLERVQTRFPEARIYQDWREMLRKERKNLDIACIGTPDHMHAPMAMSAMRAGLHVYVQKPLTHSIYEARRLEEAARRRKLVTQMGIQNHSSAEYRLAVRLIQDGVIGKVKEVHCWSNKKWGDPAPMPDRQDPVPPTLQWDLWLGVAAPRPYIKGYYHPGNWRKRIDFGTATFGDMGCHIYDPVFASLELGAPLSVRSEGPAPTAHNWAIDSVIRYVFPGTPFTEQETFAVTWYDGDRKPPHEVQALTGSQPLPDQGSLFIGARGAMLLPHRADPILLPEPQYRDFKAPAIEPANHYFQFVDAVLGKVQASAPFSYAAPLTEAVLLGPLATRFPHTTLEWNAPKMKFRNSAEANRYLRRPYRAGWRVKGLS